MVNATLLGWVGRTREELVGRKVPELLNVAGRIFYETHFAPLLRMQGFLNEIALDLKTSDGKRRAVLANAVERREADGRTAATYIVLFPASERRRYERDLVEARAVAERASEELAALNKTFLVRGSKRPSRNASRPRLAFSQSGKPRNYGSNLSPYLDTIFETRLLPSPRRQECCSENL